MPKKVLDVRGQATVEAAFAIPVVFLLLVVLVQPGIILYDRMVMQGAAAEACRMLATAGPQSGLGSERAVELVKRHLGSVPQHELFHVHEGGCSWDVQLEGGETSDVVRVSVANRLKLLPLLGAAAGLVGAADEHGCIRIQVSCQAQTQPAWAIEDGIAPSSWTTQRS